MYNFPQYRRLTRLLLIIAIVALSAFAFVRIGQSRAGSVKEPRSSVSGTSFTIEGDFSLYWKNHGGAPGLGLPISNEFIESEADGQAHYVQYFDKTVLVQDARKPAPDDISELSLGTLLYDEKYPHGAPSEQPNTTPGSIAFNRTGKRVGGAFLVRWQAGGVGGVGGSTSYYGDPVSNELLEQDNNDKQTYRVQYFERGLLRVPAGARPALLCRRCLWANYAIQR